MVSSDSTGPYIDCDTGGIFSDESVGRAHAPLVPPHVVPSHSLCSLTHGVAELALEDKLKLAGGVTSMGDAGIGAILDPFSAKRRV